MKKTTEQNSNCLYSDILSKHLWDYKLVSSYGRFIKVGMPKKINKDLKKIFVCEIFLYRPIKKKIPRRKKLKKYSTSLISSEIIQ